jgi:predicted alpha/beta-hydrolase family hydrolase
MSWNIYLAHGASGTAASMLPWTDALAARGFAASPVGLPRGRAEAAVGRFRAAAPPGSAAVVGGHSFGGRVASLLASEGGYGGLVLLSYPLHPPGSADRWEQRTAHWARIECPVLVLSGDRDPFARIELLRRAVHLVPHAELVVFPGQRHGLLPVREDAVERIEAFMRSL